MAIETNTLRRRVKLSTATGNFMQVPGENSFLIGGQGNVFVAFNYLAPVGVERAFDITLTSEIDEVANEEVVTQVQITNLTADVGDAITPMHLILDVVGGEFGVDTVDFTFDGTTGPWRVGKSVTYHVKHLIV